MKYRMKYISISALGSAHKPSRDSEHLQTYPRYTASYLLCPGRRELSTFANAAPRKMQQQGKAVLGSHRQNHCMLAVFWQS
jgi:hypothetical protein